MLHLTVGPAHQEKLKLEEQRRAAEEKYKYKKRQIRELQEDIEVNISTDIIIPPVFMLLGNIRVKNSGWTHYSQQVKQVSPNLPYEKWKS